MNFPKSFFRKRPSIAVFMHRVGSSYISQPRLWALLFLVSMMSVSDILFAPVFPFPTLLRWTALVGVAALKASLFLLLVAILHAMGKLRRIAPILVALYVLAALVNFCSWRLYGFGITQRLMTVITQTTPEETAGFLPGLLSNILSALKSPRLWLAVSCGAAILWSARWLRGRVMAIATGMLSIAGAAFMIWYLCSYQNGRTAFLLSVRLPKYALEITRSNREIAKIAALKRPFPHPEAVTSRPDPVTLMVVIGESASRAHLSAYGYPLPTSPWLASARDSVVLFADAIGSSATTAGNMERILTFKNDDATEGDWWKYPTVIDLFNVAGYKTFWLSNQERTGIWSNASGVIAASANVIDYISADNSEDVILSRHDDVMIPHVEKALADSAGKKLIFVHLMGSHTKYSQRFPRARNRIAGTDIMRTFRRPWIDNKKAAVVADYDNSIRFTDSILHVFADTLARLADPAMMIYFSDHGENVYDDRDFIGRDVRYVEVPMFIYMNAAFRHRHPQLAERAASSVTLPISTANTVYALMTLGGVGYPLYDSSRDFLNPAFRPRVRYVDMELWHPSARRN